MNRSGVINLDYVKAISFTGLRPGKIEQAKESLSIMAEKTGCNTVILTFGAIQDNAHSEYVDFKHVYMPNHEEIVETIQHIKSLGLRVFLKPYVNCKDGTWRAYISFFDEDVISEPKWSKWFEYYTDFQMYFAKLAEENDCEMLIVGCEMIQSQKREEEWRELIRNVRMVFKGLISYNTDKYQEERVTWWDAVDVISSSGYYPLNDWDRQLDRIETVVKQYNKPFFFAETGCKSCLGSSKIPNDWTLQGALHLEEQFEFFRNLFEKCRTREFVSGIGIWDWHSGLYKEQEGMTDRGYEIYGKPTCKLVYDEWNSDFYD